MRERVIISIIICGILLLVPTVAFSWYTTYSSPDGKSLSLNYTHNDTDYTSYTTHITYLYTPGGVNYGRIEKLSTSGTDFLSRQFDSKIITNYLFKGGSVKPTDKLVLNNTKFGSTYSMYKKIYGVYYYTPNGMLTGYSESGNITGVTEGQRYSGTINTFAVLQDGKVTRPTQITKLAFYKAGSLFAIATFTNHCTYTSISGYLKPTFQSLVTHTVYVNGATINSIINTTNTYDSTTKLIGTKIIGNATGSDIVNGKKVFYKSKILIQNSKTSNPSNVVYRETRTSTSSKLNRNMPYEAIFYEDLKQ